MFVPFHADKSIKEEAKERFNAFVAGDHSALPPYLRRVVFGIILSDDATDADYKAVLRTWKDSKTADSKEIALACIGDVTRSELVEETIGLILSGEIPAQDIHWPCHALATNPTTRDIWWETMKRNWTYCPWLWSVNLQNIF